MSKLERSLVGSIALTKLPVVNLFTTKKGTKCLLIPIKDNNLFEAEGESKAVYMNVKVGLYEDEDQYGQHGFISFNPKEVKIGDKMKKYKECSDDEKKIFKEKSPILGNIKDFKFTGSSDEPADTKEYTPETEGDLPF